VLQDLLIAIAASIWLLAPLGALLWFNWRAAVFGPLAFACFLPGSLELLVDSGYPALAPQ
jgi:hypothetical protein